MPQKPTYKQLEERIKKLEKKLVDCGRIEEALRKSEARFRSFLDNLGDVAYEVDANGVITYANKMAEETTGMSLKDLLGKSFLPLFIEQRFSHGIMMVQILVPGVAVQTQKRVY